MHTRREGVQLAGLIDILSISPPFHSILNCVILKRMIQVFIFFLNLKCSSPLLSLRCNTPFKEEGALFE